MAQERSSGVSISFNRNSGALHTGPEIRIQCGWTILPLLANWSLDPDPTWLFTACSVEPHTRPLRYGSRKSVFSARVGPPKSLHQGGAIRTFNLIYIWVFYWLSDSRLAWTNQVSLWSIRLRLHVGTLSFALKKKRGGGNSCCFDYFVLFATEVIPYRCKKFASLL